MAASPLSKFSQLSNSEQKCPDHSHITDCMPTNSTLLCIHRDPAQLSLLEEHGFELVTAENGREGLRLFMSRPVDAIVLEYHLGLLDGAAIAYEIKQVRPTVPIVMLADHMELPDGALKSVDALVTKSDGPHFLLATVHSVLGVKPRESTSVARERSAHPTRALSPDASFTAETWHSIWNGSVKF
jgi:two-component system, OmpR family, alkaline phosphatase synthesis response regulator PhoP